MKIPVKRISVDLAVSIRERNDEETIERYIDMLGDLPPITVFRSSSDDKYLLADGFHRLAAAERLGWEYLDAEVKEGSYEEASEFAITANLKHGKPLTSREYEMGLIKLRNLHEDWTQKKLSEELVRSRSWVEHVLAANNVEKMIPGIKVDTRTKSEISRAPPSLWHDIGHAAQEQEWTREETREKIQAIKEEPKRVQEIIQPVKIEIPEAPADKLIPLTKEINRVCKICDQFCGKLDGDLYDWGSGALALHMLHGLYVLAEKITQLDEKTSQLAAKTKKMIEFLESSKRLKPP